MADVNILITADDQASAVINNIATTALSGLAQAAAFTATIVAATLGAAFSALGVVIKESIDSASDAEQALVGLDTVLRSTAPSAGLFSETVGQLSTQSLAKLYEELDRAKNKLGEMSEEYKSTRTHTEAQTIAFEAQRQRVANLEEQIRLGADGWTVYRDTTQLSRDALIALADELQNTTMYSDEMVLSAEAMMLRFENVNSKIFPDAIRLSADLSAALGIDLTSAARMIGMALDDPAAGIGRLNMQYRIFDESQMEVVKNMAASGDVAGAQALIMDALREKVGGAAEAFGDTFVGKLEIFKNTIDDVKEIIGEPFIIVLSNLLDKVKEFIDENEALKEFLSFFSTLADYLDKDFPLLTSIGFTLINFRDAVPWFRDLGFALIDLQGMLQQGIPLWDSLKTIFADLAKDENNPLAGVATWFSNFMTTVEEEGWGVALYEAFYGLFSSIDWKAILDPIIIKVGGFINRIDWTPLVTSTVNFLSDVISLTLSGLDTIIDKVDWAPVGRALKGAVEEIFSGFMGEGTGLDTWFKETEQKINTFFANLTPKNIFLSVVDWIGDEATDIVTTFFGAFGTALRTYVTWLKNMINDYVIQPIKDKLGIASPSTVFLQFGKDIVQGLIDGLTNKWQSLVDKIKEKIDELLGSFPQWFKDIFGIGGKTSLSGITASTSAGGGSSGTLTSTATQNYYNYYYGNVYFQGTGQTNGGVDCQYPNPVLNATASAYPTPTPR